MNTTSLEGVGRCVIAVMLPALLFAACLPATRTTTPSVPERFAHGARPNDDRAVRAAVDRTRMHPRLGHDRRSLIDEASSWLGVPYLYGGNTRSGVDCSGFVCNVYRSIDHGLPRQSSQQAAVGTDIAPEEALPGDLVFFNTSGEGVSHVGIMLDYPSFIHASTARGVTVSSLTERYYGERLVAVRRVLE